jgi:CxxC motif-containing protein (DUF1111 family)
MGTAMTLISCSDDDKNETTQQPAPADSTSTIVSTYDPDEVYAGGRLGTAFITSKSAFEQPTPAIEEQGFEHSFQMGEYQFERDFNQNKTGAFIGLGPVMVRNGCLYCHPSYGYGKRTTSYRATEQGNGYLLVIYDKKNEAYIRSVAGMPQTLAVAPFKAPVDESKIKIDWKDYTDEWGNKFPDGETYSLIYPEVTIPADGFYSPIVVQRDGQDMTVDVSEIGVKLEATIGIYGTGLLDAIPEDSLIAQWKKEAKAGVSLNPAYFKDGEYVGWYTNALSPGKKWVRRFTYALSRGPVLDAAGANAIWNITNVTRSDRHWLYSTPAWAKAQSEDAEVIAYIKQHGAAESSILHPYYADGTDEGIAERVNEILSCSSIAKKETFDKYLFYGAPYNGKEEMNDKQYYQFMVWHRGLAVPAARNLNETDVQRGKELFTELGCAQCHRPSWTTGDDNMWIDASIKAYAQSIGKDASKMLPRFANQTIWPYTDMVQHRLFMKNDIRTGWCRTTPLWGRGLSRQLTGADDRLHDCRARTILEAIMWHGYSKQSDGYRATEKFYHLKKADRDAVIRFIESI